MLDKDMAKLYADAIRYKQIRILCHRHSLHRLKQKQRKYAAKAVIQELRANPPDSVDEDS